MNTGKHFGGELRRLREQAGVTLKDVAKVLGDVSVPYVSDIERGRRNPPSPSNIRLIARLLGVPDAADRLIGLAVQDRGEISLEPKNKDQRELLVSLNRSIEQAELDPATIAQINELLRSKALPKD